MDWIFIGVQLAFLLMVCLSRASLGFSYNDTSKIKPLPGKIVFVERHDPPIKEQPISEGEEKVPDTLRSVPDASLAPIIPY